tara:strand:+ start:66 stop:674 length:609 start_codon:yes stop_codon:yes gene_type:complete
MDEKITREWYLSRISPNTKGGKFAWCDPSSMYIKAESFSSLVDDLIETFNLEDIDLVTGIDAMGFVLASAIATRIKKGFLPVRKAGKIPVETSSVSFTNYSQRTQDMEIRNPAFKPGTRVLIVDQWVETGGSMEAAIELIEGQKGIVAGLACVCMEENERTQKLRQKYKCSTAVLPGTEIQEQCNNKTLKSFDDFKPANVFP